MYIKFELPSQIAAEYLDSEVKKWAQTYGIVYHKKLHKKQFRITFENDDLYSFFAMTWNPKHMNMLSYQLIEPMQTRPHKKFHV